MTSDAARLTSRALANSAPVNNQRAEMRKFAWTMSAAFAVLGAVAFYRRSSTAAIILFSASAFFLMSGLAAPMALRGIHTAWMALAHALGWINTRIILAVLFFVVLTPIGLVMRAIGRDPLSRRLDRGQTTYWHPRKTTKSPKESFEHLF